MYNCCHCLRGQCGLKYKHILPHKIVFMSLPARAVWIEIRCMPGAADVMYVTACEGSVD